jgi:hypothetical protein
MLAVGYLTAAIVLAVLILDKGEIVRLVTQDTEGQRRDTDLWIVDVEGQAFFRAGNPRVDWLARLESGEPSYLERGGRMIEIETQVDPDPKLLARLNRAMTEKYGFADRIWGWVRTWDPVAIRIHPVAVGQTTASHDEFPPQLDL